MPTSKKYRILIVEDEEALLEMYRIKLESEGFEAYTAMNGEIGILMAKKMVPDLILLDILMPKIDGYLVLKQIKSDKATKKVPVIIFSNLTQKEEIEKGLKLGAEDFIIKTSVTPATLSRKVKSFLEKRYG